MKEYHKINTIFKRDVKTNKLLIGEYSSPEIEYLKNNIWTFTEKVDGTNIRVMYTGETIKCGGKTDNAQIQPSLLEKLNEIFMPKLDLFKQLFDTKPVCLYGEGYGYKIQTGVKYRKDQSFVLFDVSIEFWWLKRSDIESLSQKLNIEIVPIIGEGTLDDMLKMGQNGFKSTWGDFIAEGIVARPKVELKARNGERIITKIKYKDFN